MGWDCVPSSVMPKRMYVHMRFVCVRVEYFRFDSDICMRVCVHTGNFRKVWRDFAAQQQTFDPYNTQKRSAKTKYQYQ